jgi:hypothetical protein
LEVPRKQEAVQRRKQQVILRPVVIGRASEMMRLPGGYGGSLELKKSYFKY